MRKKPIIKKDGKTGKYMCYFKTEGGVEFKEYGKTSQEAWKNFFARFNKQMGWKGG